MNKCSNCGAELDVGAKFCMECGTPVPQVKKCAQCGTELPLKAKFCFGCGAPQDGSVSQTTDISMGDKNVIAGDVVGQKVAGDNVQNKIMGNAIYNTIQDDTKRVNSCHVCGKHLTNVNGHTCPCCGNVVCDEHFDAKTNLCLKCVEVKKQDALKQYESALLSIGANGRIDIIERNKLDVLANTLGLSKAETLPLEQKFKLKVNVSTLTRTERMTLESVQKAYFEGKLEDYFDDIKKLFECNPNDEEVVNWYLRFARVLEPDETIDVIAKLQGEFCESYLSLVCIYLFKKELPEAELALNKAKQVWPDVPIVKLVEVLFLIKLYLQTDKSAFLDEARGALQKIESTSDEYESFLLKNERILLACLCGDKSDWDDFENVFFKLFEVRLVVASNRNHLIQLIDEAIEENGLECDLNYIDVSNVKDMSKLFCFEPGPRHPAKFNDDQAFKRSKFNGDISQWNVSNVTDMSFMFLESRFNGDISQWNVSNVTNMYYMFGFSKFKGDISKWNVSNVTNMSMMFWWAREFDGDISKWDVLNVTDVGYMFSGSRLEQNGKIPYWYKATSKK
ncbi:BspA family leucine-rich repeat surface protein [Fibrobacter sp. UWB12]|uniref:BspA family leucine-rich repeat surface protein n=1 Tax=Fibrobacter sp. UWB12 TaxID=1896203 RepID=UPI0009188AFE|nr:BspA family leucine-rich repeat surface protein [Fibrobacter sp. UWB12]SHK66702.1 surface protein [Fibrobacter sp. UWB12]